MRIKATLLIPVMALTSCQAAPRALEATELAAKTAEESVRLVDTDLACDHVIVAGEFYTIGELPFRSGMTVQDVYEAAVPTYRLGPVWVERNGRLIAQFHGTGANERSAFKLEPCDTVRRAEY